MLHNLYILLYILILLFLKDSIMSRKIRLSLLILFPLIVLITFIISLATSKNSFDWNILWSGIIGASTGAWITVILIILESRPSKTLFERIKWDLIKINFNFNYALLNMIGFEDTNIEIFELNEMSDYKDSFTEFVDNSNKALMQMSDDNLFNCFNNTDYKSLQYMIKELTGIQTQLNNYSHQYKDKLLSDQNELILNVQDATSNILFNLRILGHEPSKPFVRIYLQYLSNCIKDYIDKFNKLNDSLSPNWLSKWWHSRDNELIGV